MNGKRAKKLRRTANYLLKAWIVRNTNNDADINDPMLGFSYKKIRRSTYYTIVFKKLASKI